MKPGFIPTGHQEEHVKLSDMCRGQMSQNTIMIETLRFLFLTRVDEKRHSKHDSYQDTFWQCEEHVNLSGMSRGQLLFTKQDYYRETLWHYITVQRWD